MYAPKTSSWKPHTKCIRSAQLYHKIPGTKAPRPGAGFNKIVYGATA